MAEILDDEEMERKIESFELIPSDGGRFEFSVNDELLYSKKQTGRHAEPREIYDLLKKRMETD